MDRTRDLAQGLSRIENNTYTALQPKKTTVIDFAVAGAAATTGPFFALTALSDAVLDISGDENIVTPGATLAIAKGITIYGNFGSIELDSGIVIAYSK